jgi:hypothetical protein
VPDSTWDRAAAVTGEQQNRTIFVKGLGRAAATVISVTPTSRILDVHFCNPVRRELGLFHPAWAENTHEVGIGYAGGQDERN